MTSTGVVDGTDAISPSAIATAAARPSAVMLREASTAISSRDRLGGGATARVG
jgi:hypothetical protein